MAWNPKLKVNLLDVFNRVYSDKPYEVRRALREVIRRSTFKDDYGLKAIDVITERTLGGKDKYGEGFAAYSKSYKESLIFEIYGKGSKVDLKLSGEMLASMQVKSAGDTITINFVDDLNAAKAHGHINGIKTKTGKVVRDFFGLSKDEEDQIMKETIAEYGDATSQRVNDLLREVAG